MPLDVPGVGPITVDVAYGGCFYVLVAGAELGVRLTRERARDVVERAELVMAAARRADRVRHPEIPEIDFLSYVMVIGDDDPAGGRLRGATVLSGRVDRSPCGTGTSARLACMAARGLAGSDHVRRHVTDRQRVRRLDHGHGDGRRAAGGRAEHLGSWLDLRHEDRGGRSNRPLPDGVRVERSVGPPAAGRPAVAISDRDRTPPDRAAVRHRRSARPPPRAVAGARVRPYMPWPPATTTLANRRVRPMSGSPSALIGREPAQTSRRDSQSRSRNRRIDRRMASTRRASNDGDHRPTPSCRRAGSGRRTASRPRAPPPR